jgi:hypothetical protein
MRRCDCKTPVAPGNLSEEWPDPPVVSSTADRAPVNEDATKGAGLYLDIMKRCLTDSIDADDALANFVPYRSKSAMPWHKKVVVRAIVALLARYRLRVVESCAMPWIPDSSALSAAERARLRESGAVWPVRAHTMIGIKKSDDFNPRSYRGGTPCRRDSRN